MPTKEWLDQMQARIDAAYAQNQHAPNPEENTPDTPDTPDAPDITYWQDYAQQNNYDVGSFETKKKLRNRYSSEIIPENIDQILSDAPDEALNPRGFKKWQKAREAYIERSNKELDELAPSPVKPKGSLLDPLTGAAIGVNTTLKSIADLFGTSGYSSQFFESNIDTLRGNLSDAAKNRQVVQQEKKQNASWLDKAGLEFKRYLTTPEGFGEGVGQIGTFLMGVRAAGAGAAGTMGLGLGAAIGAGSVKGNIADTINQASKDELMQDPVFAELLKRVPEQQARQTLGTIRSSYGEAYGKIAIGAIAGVADRFLGIGRAVTDIGKVAAQSAGKTALKRAIEEPLKEVSQENIEQVLGNTGAAAGGAAIDPLRGTAEATGGALAMGGLGSGAVAGATLLSNNAPTQQPQQTAPQVISTPSAINPEALSFALQGAPTAPAIRNNIERNLALASDAGTLSELAQEQSPQGRAAARLIEWENNNVDPTNSNIDASITGALPTVNNSGETGLPSGNIPPNAIAATDSGTTQPTNTGSWESAATSDAVSAVGAVSTNGASAESIAAQIESIAAGREQPATLEQLSAQPNTTNANINPPATSGGNAGEGGINASTADAGLGSTASVENVPTQPIDSAGNAGNQPSNAGNNEPQLLQSQPERINTSETFSKQGGVIGVPALAFKKKTAYAESLSKEAIDNILSIGNEIGWAEIGGELIRDTSGNAINRTNWIPISSFWPKRPEPISVKDAKNALINLEQNKPLSAIQKRFIDYAREYIKREYESIVTEQVSVDNEKENNSIIINGDNVAENLDADSLSAATEMANDLEPFMDGKEVTEDDFLAYLGMTKDDLYEGTAQSAERKTEEKTAGSAKGAANGFSNDIGKNIEQSPESKKENGVAKYRRSAIPAANAKQITDAIVRKWVNAPDVVVVQSMQDVKVPEAVRSEDAKQITNGAAAAKGFYYKGKVYLVTDGLSNERDVVETLFHEALGHYGLRSVFGDSLNPILNQIVRSRRDQVLKKAKDVGIDTSTNQGLRDAAEEILAEMAQENPKLEFVRRAVAIIKTWLRKNVPAFKNIKLSDDEIIRNFILPAREWVKRGKMASDSSSAIAFNRAKNDDIKKDDIQQNIKNKMLEAYLDDLTSREKRIRNLKNNYGYIWEKHSADKIKKQFDDDLPEGVFEILQDSDSVVETREGDNEDSQYHKPEDMPEDEFWNEAIIQEFGRQPKDFDDILDNLKKNSEMDAVSEAAQVLAESEGFKVELDHVSENGTKYYKLTNGNGSEINLRISDHAKQSAVGHATKGKSKIHINLAPVDKIYETDDFYSMVDKLRKESNTVNSDSEEKTLFSRRPTTLAEKEQILKTGKMPEDKVSFNDLGDKLVTLFTDSTRPFDVWLRSLPNQNLAASMSQAKDLAVGRKGAFEREVISRFGNKVADGISAIAKAKKLDYQAAVESVGNWMSARYALIKNQDFLRQDQMAIDDLTAQIEEAKQANDAEKIDSLQGELAKAQKKLADRTLDITSNKIVDPTVTKFRVGVAGGYNNATANKMIADSEARISRKLLDQASAPVYDMLQWKLAQDIANGKVTQQVASKFLNSPIYVPLTGAPLVDETDTDIFSTGSLNQEKNKKAVGRAGSLAQNGIDAAFEQVEKSANYYAWLPFKDALTNAYDAAIADSISLGMTAAQARQDVFENYGISRAREEHATFRSGEDVIIVRKNGESFAYNINNKAAIDALKSVNKEQVPTALKPIAYTTRIFSRLVTMFLPGFALINAPRDVWEKSENIRTRGVPGYDLDMNKVARRMLAIAGNPKTLAAIAPVVSTDTPFQRFLKVNPDNQDSALLQEFMAAGGTSTTAGYLGRGSEALAKQFKTKDAIGTKAFKAIEAWNNAFELVSSFSAFKALRESGVDTNAASATTLNLMNFNKSGTIMGPIKAFYMFAQPAAAGAQQLGKTLATSRGRRRFTAYVLAGMGLYSMLRSGEDDDELGVNRMDELSNYTLERNIPIPVGDNDYLKIPVGFGLPQLAWSFAVNLTKMLNGSQSATEAAAELSKGITKTITPVAPSETSIAKQPAVFLTQTLSPQIIKPLVNVAIDRNAFGSPLTNARFFKEDAPKSEQGRRNTPEEFKDVAKELGGIFGIDIYPEQVRELSHYLMGPFNELMKVMIENPAKEERGLEPVSPAVDRWVARQDDESLRQKLYYRYREDMNAATIKGALDPESINNYEKSMAELGKEVKRRENSTRGKIGSATKARKEGRTEQAKQLSEEADKIRNSIQDYVFSRMKVINAAN